MTKRDREYDRFGPWVLEITDADPPPPRFLPYLTRSDEPMASIKIPRHIERRQAHPGMDLYDYVVSLYADDVVVLERDGEDIREHAFAYMDIKHLRVDEELLRGRLRLALDGNRFELPYNTVSSDVMARLVAIIRERYAGPGAVARPAADLDLGGDDLSFYFDRLLRAERSTRSGMQALAAQSETNLGEVETSLIRRAIYGVVRKRLLEALWLSDGRELKIIDRGSTYAYRWKSTYGTGTSYLPLANLEAVRWKDGGAGLTGLRLRSAGGDLDYAFSGGNETVPTLKRYLETVA